MPFSRLRSGQNRFVALVVPRDRKNDSRHFLEHMDNDVHIAQSLRRFLFAIDLEHRSELYRNGTSHPDGPARMR